MQSGTHDRDTETSLPCGTYIRANAFIHVIVGIIYHQSGPVIICSSQSRDAGLPFHPFSRLRQYPSKRGPLRDLSSATTVVPPLPMADARAMEMVIINNVMTRLVSSDTRPTAESTQLFPPYMLVHTYGG